MDTGWVWMRSTAETWASEFVIECVSADSDYSLTTSMSSLNLSWIFEVDEVAFDGLLVTPGSFLFCLPSLCARPIMLVVVDE